MRSIFRNISFILLCFCIECLASCNSKNTPINNLEDLTEDVKANYENYTENDWQIFAEEYEQIKQELEQYQDQYSDEEKKEIGRLKGICLGYVAKYSVKSFKKNVEDALKEVEGIFDGFLDAFGDDLDEACFDCE